MFILTIGLQQFIVLIFAAIDTITAAITGLSGGGSAATIGDVVFNRCEITSANFFPEVFINTNGTANTVGTLNILPEIAKYYYIIRGLAIAILLGILLYVGIRMAISTVASEEAKYKKMLMDWAVSLVILFLLHYIIILVFFFNNVIVDALSYMEPSNTGFFDMLKLAADAAVPLVGLDDLIVYGALVVGTFAFVIMYLRRTIVLAFLIVISPLITITYAIDKMGDGKSQALNTWLREFVFTVIIQPFHCIIYLVFYGSIMSMLDNSGANMGQMIFVAASAFFMLKAEGIVKKIFGIQPSGIGDAIGTGAMALTMATSMFKGGKGKKVDESKGTMPNMEKNNANSNSQNSSNPNPNNGSGSGNPPAEPSGSEGGGNPPTPPNPPSNGSENQPSKIKSALNSIENSWVGKRWKRNGGLSGFVGRKISGAVTMAGMIAGATVGDFKTAASVGTAAGSIAKNKYDDLMYKRAEGKLERNQQVFAGAYQDFERAYKEAHEGEDVSDQQIRAAAKQIFDGNGTDLDSQYERDFRDKMEQLSTSAEIIGYKNGFDYVNESMRLAQQGVVLPNDNYVPKYYEKATTKK